MRVRLVKEAAEQNACMAEGMYRGQSLGCGVYWWSGGVVGGAEMMYVVVVV